MKTFFGSQKHGLLKISRESLTKKSGFTFIELLIIISIIAIISTIVIVSLVSAREKSKIARFKAQARAVQARAVSECSGQSLTVSVLGGNMSNAYNITNLTDQSCGGGGNFTFNIQVQSIGLVAPCTATMMQTGIINFNPC